MLLPKNLLLILSFLQGAQPSAPTGASPAEGEGGAAGALPEVLADPGSLLQDPQAAMEELMKWAVTYAPKILGAILTLVVGLWLARLLSRGVRKLLVKGKADEALARFLGSVAYFALLALVVVATISKLGVETASFVAILGAAGLAIGFALQGSLGNLAAGVMIMLFRPFKLGDYVEAGGQAGVVEEIQVFATVMRSPDNKKIIIPNSKITDGSIVNYSAKPNRRLDMVFGISYGDDIRKARDIINKVLQGEPRVLAEPKPIVAVSELADSSVNFVVRPWVKTEDYWPTRFDLIERIKVEFDQQGISIPFPQRDVHLHQVGAPAGA